MVGLFLSFCGFGGILDFADRLDLTDDQVEAIRKLEREHKLRAADLEAKLKKLRARWDYEMTAEEPNFKRLRQLANQIADTKAKLEAERLKFELSILEVLTPEQRERWRKLRHPWSRVNEELERIFRELEQELPGLKMRIKVFEEEKL